MFEIGDLVRIQDYFPDADGPDPNGFVGFISEAHVMADALGDFANGEVVYTVNLPICWDESETKHSWTFKTEDLTLVTD